MCILVLAMFQEPILQFTSKVRTFLGLEGNLAAFHNFKGLFEDLRLEMGLGQGRGQGEGQRVSWDG